MAIGEILQIFLKINFTSEHLFPHGLKAKCGYLVQPIQLNAETQSMLVISFRII